MGSEPGFWDDADRASRVMQERNHLQSIVKGLDDIGERLDEVELYLEMMEDPEEAALAAEEANSALDGARVEIEALETQRMLSGEHDQQGAILTINSGAGGTDSQDWAEMLLRMYSRYCERKGFKVTLTDLQAGQEAGIKSAEMEVTGPYAYGFLKAEIGVHRLVRISPFDSAGRRHTAFASVYCIPDLDDTIKVDIADKDLRIDTYRASGAGGQHVNKTDSAIRITHIPTGIVVQCQNERSQHKNKATAMKLLMAKLLERERREREKELDAANAEKRAVEWGSQIRSYVLYPYRMVKDLRTEVESSNTDDVLDGDLDGFISAYLLQSSEAQRGSMT